MAHYRFCASFCPLRRENRAWLPSASIVREMKPAWHRDLQGRGEHSPGQFACARLIAFRADTEPGPPSSRAQRHSSRNRGPFALRTWAQPCFRVNVEARAPSGRVGCILYAKYFWPRRARAEEADGLLRPTFRQSPMATRLYAVRGRMRRRLKLGCRSSNFHVTLHRPRRKMQLPRLEQSGLRSPALAPCRFPC